MKSLNLSELSEQELIKKEKNLKTASDALTGILSLLALAIILLFVQGQFSVALPLLVVLFSMVSILFMSKKELDDVKTELEKRNNYEI